MMDMPQLRALLDALAARFAREEQVLNALDAAIGDGDHGTTILRGMRAAGATARASTAERPGTLLLEVAAAFQKATGGAGGTLFAQIFKGLGTAAGTAETLDRDAVALGLSSAVTLVARLGRARLGGKTMFDALEPASRVLSAGGSLAEATATAEQGMESTRGMSATLGRARYVAEGGRGHIDPGAWSVALILATLTDQAAGTDGQQGSNS